MPVPTYDRFIEPILRYLAAHPNGVAARDAYEAAADALGLSELDRQEQLPSKVQSTYKNRAGWAHDRLKRAGLSGSARRGFWQLTPEGHTFASNFRQLSAAQVEELATGHTDVRLGSPEDADDRPVETRTTLPQELGTSTPDDRLEEALVELRATVTAELLDVLHRVSPTFFETIVLDLLHRMGYGASRADLQRVGGSGDGGIDGIISLDKLGLEKVYVQAKRWQQSVGRPAVQAFYGALAGHRANKGVFITTSDYTAQAAEFARSVERVVLVDGAKLAGLMIDHEVGVSSRPIRIPKLDSDYFDEESA